jgi:hypothetical protein
MGGRRSFEVGELLIKVMKEDPSFDVAKEAQLSFEQNTDHTFRLFDIPAIDAWWKTQTSCAQSRFHAPNCERRRPRMRSRQVKLSGVRDPSP